MQGLPIDVVVAMRQYSQPLRQICLLERNPWCGSCKSRVWNSMLNKKVVEKNPNPTIVYKRVTHVNKVLWLHQLLQEATILSLLFWGVWNVRKSTQAVSFDSRSCAQGVEVSYRLPFSFVSPVKSASHTS